MNISQLRFFTAITGTGSLSAAARQTGVTQPALSKYLSSLERGLGMKLFYRVRGKLRLTAAGCVYLASASKILEIEQSTISKAKNLNSKIQPIYIGGTPYEGARIVAQAYPAFKQRFPAYDLRLKEGYTQRLYELVHSGEVSLALATYLETDLNIDFLPTHKEELVLCLPSYYRPGPADFSASAVDLREFANIPFALMTGDTTIGLTSRRLLARVGMDPLVVFQSDNVYLVHEMVLAGAGGGLVPIKLAAKPDPRVNYFRLKESELVTYGVVTKKGHTFTDPERFIIYCLIKLDEKTEFVRFCWNDLLYEIADQFDAPEERIFPVGGIV